MKNKKILYILIPAVVIIWGLIIYKVIDYFMDDQATSFLVNKSEMKVPRELQRDTYTLLASNPDPFGLNEHRSSSSTNGKKLVKAQTVWPEVRLYGVLLADKKKNSVASLKINDRNMVMKTGDTCQGIRLSKISESSISLRYNGEKKVVSLEQENNRK